MCNIKIEAVYEPPEMSGLFRGFGNILVSRKFRQLINTDFRSYNYDVIDGVTYEIDVTQPAKYDPSSKCFKQQYKHRIYW